MRKCSKCSSQKELEEHHYLPQVHYGSGTRKPHTITLCHQCHLKIEIILEAVESYKGNVRFGTRHKLYKEEYVRIHRNWLSDSSLITITFR